MRDRLLRPATAVAALVASGALPASAAATVTTFVSGSSPNRTLNVLGNSLADTITLQLKKGDATRLQVVVAGQATPFEHQLTTFDKILVDGGGGLFGFTGANSITIDDSNGAFTTTKPTTLEGDAGKDTLMGGAGAEMLAGGFDADSLYGGGGADQLFGERGNDRLYGGDGDDTLQGNEDADSVYGEAGNDSLTATADTASEGFSVADVLGGGTGNDTIDGGPPDTNFPSNSHMDTVYEADGGSYTLTATSLTGAGTDSFINIEAGFLSGQNGSNDSIDAAAFPGPVILNGGGGDDTLVSGQGDDQIIDDAGANTVNAGAGRDTLFTGAGNDSLLGGDGQDWMVAGAGDDVVRGEGGFDLLTPGTGTDQVFGGLDDAMMFDTVGSAEDDVTVGGVPPNVTMTGALGSDNLSSITQIGLTGASGSNRLDASAFAGPVTLTGLAGADTLISSSSADSLLGGTGNDALRSGAGDDTVSAEDGTDTIEAADGNDRVSGGDGADSIDAGGSITYTADRLVETDTGSLRLFSAALIGRMTAFGGDTDTLDGVDAADLTSGSGADSLDVRDSLFPVTLDAGGGNDTLVSGGRADSLVAGDGADLLTAGGGNDTLVGGTGSDFFEDAILGSATLTGSQLATTQQGTDVFSGIEQAALDGWDGGSRLDASAFTGSLSLSGGSGADTLLGGSAPDMISGSGGDDTLRGDGGSDQLYGGEGSDLLDQPVTSSFELRDTLLTGGGVGTDTLSSIDRFATFATNQGELLNAEQFSGQTTLNGALGSDTLKGGTGPDSLIGGAGNDLLTPGLGNDSIDGGGDEDTLKLAGDSLTLTAGGATGQGSDSHGEIERALLEGMNAPSSLDASTFEGAATLDGFGGNDTLTGGRGSDTIRGGEAADRLNGGNADGVLDTLSGGNGIDRMLSGCACNVTLQSSNLDAPVLGSDQLSDIEEAELSSTGANVVFDATSFPGPVTLNGGAGNDQLIGGGLSDSLSGGSGTDHITGNLGDDRLAGGEGGDELRESGATQLTLADSSMTGRGTDTLSGFERANIVAGAGASSLDASGFGGDVTLFGSAADDTLTGAGGNDVIYPLAGNDLLTAAGDVNFALSGDASGAQLQGRGSDTVFAGLEAASLTGGAGANVLDASAAGIPVTLAGSAGADTLTGGAANDSLAGGAGADRLDGRGGADTLSCGDDLDTFEPDPLDVLGVDCEPPGSAETTVEGSSGTQPVGGQQEGGQQESGQQDTGQQTGGMMPVPGNPDGSAPLVLRFVAAPPTFRLAGTNTASSGARRPPKGTTLEYELSEDATAKIVLSRLVPGLRVKSSRARKAKLVCKPATPAVKSQATREVAASVSRTLPAVQRKKRMAALLKARKCTATKPVATLTRKARKGRNKLPFSGRVDRKPLPLGRYEAALTATDAATNVSKPRKIRFKIVR